MKINLPPQSPLAATAAQAQAAGGAQPLSAFMMAPVELTPLAPPSSASVATVAPESPIAQERSPAAERRQAFFADRQKALLDRLNRPAAIPQPAQGSILPAPQRAACVAVLQSMAAASAADE